MPRDLSFVSYATTLYRCPGVERACIRAQDIHGLDVNMILFCAWSGFCRRHLLIEGEIALLGEVSALWQHSIIQQLRSGRRWLKSQRVPDLEGLRERMLAIEIEFERVEQMQLEAAFENFYHSQSSDDETSLVRKNLDIYARACSIDLIQNEDLTESIIVGCEAIQDSHVQQE